MKDQCWFEEKQNGNDIELGIRWFLPKAGRLPRSLLTGMRNRSGFKLQLHTFIPGIIGWGYSDHRMLDFRCGLQRCGLQRCGHGAQQAGPRDQPLRSATPWLCARRETCLRRDFMPRRMTHLEQVSINNLLPPLPSAPLL